MRPLVSAVQDPPPTDAASQPRVCAKQADAGLDVLLTVLLSARSDMRSELRRQPPDGEKQSILRRRLLGALEGYTAALSARGLPVPPALRDELALQRNLAARYFR